MSRKLLVADDSVTIQKVIKLALSSEGYNILAVSDGKEAIRAIQEEKPDVVLIDVTLPVADAYAVKRVINANPKLASIGFVLMLSAFERIDEDAIDEVKFQGRLIKPFDPSHLRKAVADILNNKSGSDLISNSDSDADGAPAFVMAPPPLPPQAEETTVALETTAGSDLPPVSDMHPTIAEEPIEQLTEEDFQREAPLEVTTPLTLNIGLSAKPGFVAPPPPPPGVTGPTAAAMAAAAAAAAAKAKATLFQSPVPPPPSPPSPPPPPEYPAETEERTDPNLVLPSSEEAAEVEEKSRSLENDIRDLTESTIKMSGLDEWSLDDSRHKKEKKVAEAGVSISITPAAPPKEEPKHELNPTSLEKRAAVIRGLMIPPAMPIDDGNSTFPIDQTASSQQKQRASAMQPQAAPPMPPKQTSAPKAPSMTASIPKPASASSLTLPPATQPSSELPPVANLHSLTRAEVEQLVRKELEGVIEKLAKDLVPRIAESIIRQEIEKILSEP